MIRVSRVYARPSNKDARHESGNIRLSFPNPSSPRRPRRKSRANENGRRRRVDEDLSERRAKKKSDRRRRREIFTLTCVIISTGRLDGLLGQDFCGRIASSVYGYEILAAPARRRRRRRFRAVERVNGVSAAGLPVYICVTRATPPPPPPPHAMVVAASSRVHDFIPTLRGSRRPRGRNEHVIVN